MLSLSVREMINLESNVMGNFSNGKEIYSESNNSLRVCEGFSHRRDHQMVQLF